MRLSWLIWLIALTDLGVSCCATRTFMKGCRDERGGCWGRAAWLAARKSEIAWIGTNRRGLATGSGCTETIIWSYATITRHNDTDRSRFEDLEQVSQEDIDIHLEAVVQIQYVLNLEVEWIPRKALDAKLSEKRIRLSKTNLSLTVAMWYCTGSRVCSSDRWNRRLEIVFWKRCQIKLS